MKLVAPATCTQDKKFSAIGVLKRLLEAFLSRQRRKLQYSYYKTIANTSRGFLCPLFLKTSPYISYLPFSNFLHPPPLDSPSPPTPTSIPTAFFVVLFLWLDG